MRAWESEAIASGTSADQLMEEAGKGAADWICREYSEKNSAVIWVGKGNNGGDGLVVARLLAESNWEVTVWLAYPKESMSELGQKKLDELAKVTTGLQVQFAESGAAPPYPCSNGLLVDALLGIGMKGTLRGHLKEAIAGLNERRRLGSWDVVALDVPSGLSPATKETNDAVTADVTLTFGFPKASLCEEVQADWVGRIEMISLSGAASPNGSREMICPKTLAASYPRRLAQTNKGSHGRVVIVGGSHGYSGAPVLSALGALRSGAGLVRIITPESSLLEVASRAPAEIMVSGWTSPTDVIEACESASAIVIGPGMGLSNDAARLLEVILKSCLKPMVIDADALTLLSRMPDWRSWWQGNRILTPHPGEAARLLGRKFAPSEREAVVEEISHGSAGSMILKGVRTIIASPGTPLLFNSTGNAGLAKGGTGDVLAGLIASFLAQELPPSEAMALGVWLHGRSADLMLQKDAMESLLASEIANGLSRALRDLRERQ